MNNEMKDFRKYLGCCGCWGRDYTVLGEFVCLFSMFDKNRPDSIPPHKLRYQLSGKTDREALMKWRCEFRYSSPEIEQIRSGQYTGEKMSKDHAKKVMSVIHPVMTVTGGEYSISE